MHRTVSIVRPKISTLHNDPTNHHPWHNESFEVVLGTRVSQRGLVYWAVGLVWKEN
jgi:hypothetical protein